MRNIIGLIILFVLFYPLSLSAQNSSDKPAEVESSFTVDREGTRSEARHYTLTINKRIIPGFFNYIEVNGILYVLSIRENLWGSDGYEQITHKEELYKKGSTTITELDRKTGWYKSAERKKKTPKSWCWIKRGELTAFVDPDKLIEFAKAQDLEEIPVFVMEDWKKE